jgi:ribonuclease HII
MLAFEQAVRKAGYRRVGGIDEAGRGPLAGPVVAAAVVISPALWDEPDGFLAAGLNDSKRLSPRRREYFYDRLLSHPEVWTGIGLATVEEIDRLNILRATHCAMRRAVEALPELPDVLLVDGLPVPGLPVRALPIVGGDGRSLMIAAASVVAKVTRDRWMVELDAAFPGYGFARHKGYGTRAHLDALQQLGPTPQHRRSFGPVAQLEFAW